MKRQQRQEVLEKLIAARNPGTKLSAQYQLEENTEEAFEELTEEEYQRRVEANKKAKFIVDDFGLGYDDEGEMEYEEDGELEEPHFKKTKPETKPITSFLKPSKIAAKVNVAPKPKVGDAASLELMKKLLEEEEDPRRVNTYKKAKVRDFGLGYGKGEDAPLKRQKLEPKLIPPLKFVSAINEVSDVAQATVPCMPPITVTCDLGHPNVFKRAEIGTNNGLCCTLPTHSHGVISTIIV